MTRKSQDRLEREIEDALEPGEFIGFRRCAGFVEDADIVRREITSLIRDGDPRRAVTLLETFIAGCYEKSEELDDSDGSFGQFVEQLFCDWILARQAAGAVPDQTVEMLLAWMEDDDYGYCHRLEEEAVNAFNKTGLAALERAVRSRMAGQKRSDYPHRRSVEILKAIFTKRRDVREYADLCEAENDLAPKDCETLAEMSLKRRRVEDALAWTERGLALEGRNRWPNRAAWRLPALHRTILKRLGRTGEALAAAWEEYRKAPSPHDYKELMKFVPKEARSDWHARAIAILDGADLSARIGIFMLTGERQRLGAVIESARREDLMALGDFTLEPVARKLQRSHPRLTAKLRIAMGLAIVEAKKSKYYDAALGHFEKARDILNKQGCTGEWQQLAAEVRDRHGRKSRFMPGFERLVQGRTAVEPSFLDRARQKWKGRARMGNR